MTCPSAEQKTFFEDHGWVVRHGAVSSDSLAAITDAFDRVTQQAATNGRSIWQVPGVSGQRETLLAHIYRGLGAFVADLLSARRIQLLQDTLIVKPANFGASIDLHQDYAYTGFLDPPN